MRCLSRYAQKSARSGRCDGELQRVLLPVERHRAEQLEILVAGADVVDDQLAKPVEKAAVLLAGGRRAFD